jgi:glycosyltransferase involved in cell wall biosynthesis
MRRSRPAVVLGHEPLACAHLAPQSVHHHTIYHFHELPETYPGMGVGARLAYGKATRNSRQVDLVIFSDGMRARRYQTEAELPARPSVVMNCPRRMDKVPSSPLRQQLALNTQHSTLNLQPFTQLVCYLGSIGSNQGLPEAALSMRYWPPDSVFLLIGPYSEALQRRIVDNARAVGAEHRVLFLGAKPHQQALALAAGAGLGLSLIQPNSPNLLYSAGAVNKRFEYMALGVPQITNNGPGVADIIERNQCGLCVDPNRPEEVGAAVNRLLRNPALLRQMGKNGRRLHLARYSYEVEFGPVQQQIARWCAGEEPGGLGSP